MYQITSAQKKPTAIHQKRAVPSALRGVHTVAAQAASTTVVGRFAAPGTGWASPSGSRPMSCGLWRTSRFSGPSTHSTTMPSAQHASRQPRPRMIDCSQGSSTMAPTPTPEKAMPIAIARRRRNQLGRNSDCAVKLIMLAPAPVARPARDRTAGIGHQRRGQQPGRQQPTPHSMMTTGPYFCMKVPTKG